MTKRRRLPIGRWLQPYPDCCAEVVDNELLHEPTCPLQAGVDAACDEDRAWFDAHPMEWTRTRPISRAELQALDHLGTLTPTDRPDHVHVINQPFGRIRTFCNSADFSGLAIDPDDEGVA